MATKRKVKKARLVRPPTPADIKFDREVFAAALDRVVVSEEFGKELDQYPLKTLKKLGITLDPATARRLRGKTLREGIPIAPGGEVMTVAVSVSPYVWVAVAVWVATSADRAPGEVIQPARKRRLITKVQRKIKAQQMAWKTR